MDHNKRILMLAVCIPLIIGLLGCASGGTTAVDREQAENAVAWPGGIYVPKYPLGVETLDAARKDLAGLLQRDTIDAYAGVRYFGRLDLDNSAYRKDPAAYARMVQAYMLIRDARGEFQYFLPRGGFVVLHDQIKVNPIFTLLYEDLIDRPITAEKRWNEEIRTSWPDINGNIVDDTIAGKYGIQYRPMYQRPYRVRCSGLIAFFFKKPTEAQRFADDLFFIQQTLKKHDETQRALFESQAAQYRALSTKPPISEAQRKYIVQANALNRLKDYAGAIGLYQKAITIDPVSYPGAYFNLALLNAQLQRYRTAITYMKQYLQLVPDAADARSAQDKIYEWELMIPAERNDSKAGPQARGYLGARIQSSAENAAAFYGIEDGKGALVVEVMNGSPAQIGGLKAGDIIRTFDGMEIKEARDLVSTVAATPVGKTVEVGIRRANQDQTLKVTIVHTPE